jgi:hypothetical protein
VDRVFRINSTQRTTIGAETGPPTRPLCSPGPDAEAAEQWCGRIASGNTYVLNTALGRLMTSVGHLPRGHPCPGSQRFSLLHLSTPDQMCHCQPQHAGPFVRLPLVQLLQTPNRPLRISCGVPYAGCGYTAIRERTTIMHFDWPIDGPLLPEYRFRSRRNSKLFLLEAGQ